MNGRVRDIYALFAAIVLLIAAFIGPEVEALSLIHISEPTRRRDSSRMPSSA